MHDIEFDEFGARIAWADHIDPWHGFGVPMRGLQTVEAMLAAARADYHVELLPVVAVGPDGQPLRNPDGSLVFESDSRMTVRVNRDGSMDGLATVGTRYVVNQNDAVTRRALAIVGASGGDAVMDVVGVLDGGREFFATVDLGPLVIDPTGVNDRIDRYMVVRNSFNGKVAMTYANTDVRAVCKNTVLLAQRKARRVYKARHTRNVDEISLEEARQVLEMSVDWAKGFKEIAERMLSVPMPSSSARFDRVMTAAFPLADDASDNQRFNWNETVGSVKAIFANSRNAGAVGENGWAAYNAVVEYLDHHRPGKPQDRFVATMNDNSWVSQTKLRAQAAVLA